MLLPSKELLNKDDPACSNCDKKEECPIKGRVCGDWIRNKPFFASK